MGSSQRAALLLLTTLPLLTGCQTLPREQVRDFSPVELGTTLTLAKSVTVPADTTALWFRDGHPVAGRWVAAWEYTCGIHLKVARSTPYRMSSGSFRVIGTKTRIRTTGMHSFAVVTDLALASADHPAARKISCVRWTGYGRPGYGPRFSPVPANGLMRAFGAYIQVHLPMPPTS
jgi:hypothetical protein